MKEHGSYELEIQSKTLVFRAYSSWNYETTISWGKEAKDLAKLLKHEPWICLIDLTNWELITPDVREYISEINLWANENNLKYLAVVYGFEIQKKLLQKSFRVLTNVDCEYFKDLDDANKWLNSVEI